MPNLRYATSDDAGLIAAHRHSMFQDNNFASESHLAEMDTTFEPWVRERLVDGRYIGLLLEEDGRTLAGAGIFIQDFPPHWMDIQPTRAYLLNFYTAPAARGRGFAKQMLKLCMEECRTRGIGVVTLHASPFGRPIYEKFGFSQSTEMMLQLQTSQ
jgi:GNAT superfamily N-acetyltransferase